MPTFTPGTPPSNQVLAVTQPLLQGNLDFLQQSGNIDHVFTGTSTPSPTNPPAASNGWHKIIHMIPQALPVGAISGGQLFANSANVTGGGVQLAYEDSLGKITQLTNSTGASSGGNGYTFLPGGLMLLYGFVTTNFSSGQGGGTGTVTFSANGQPNFGTAIRAFSTTMAGTSTTANIVEITGTSTSSFSWQFTGGTGTTSYTGFSWIMIGV